MDGNGAGTALSVTPSPPSSCSPARARGHERLNRGDEWALWNVLTRWRHAVDTHATIVVTEHKLVRCAWDRRDDGGVDTGVDDPARLLAHDESLAESPPSVTKVRVQGERHYLRRQCGRAGARDQDRLCPDLNQVAAGRFPSPMFPSPDMSVTPAMTLAQVAALAITAFS